MALLAASSALALAALPAAAQMNQPGTAPAKGDDAPKSAVQSAGNNATDPQADAPIVPDAAFNSALPPLSNDINAPLEPMPLDDASTTIAVQKSKLPALNAPAPVAQSAAQAPIVPGALPAPAPIDPQLAAPLEPLSTFNTEPLQSVAEVKGRNAPEIAYDTEVRGLDPLKLTDEFNSLSALKEGKGKAANATQVSARAREDEALAVRLMKSLGYYDGTAVSTLEQPAAGSGNKLRAIVSATPLAPSMLSSSLMESSSGTCQCSPAWLLSRRAGSRSAGAPKDVVMVPRTRGQAPRGARAGACTAVSRGPGRSASAA